MSLRTDHPTDSDITDVGLLVFDGVTLLDVSGPAEVFSRARGFRLSYLSADGGHVTTGCGMTLATTLPMAECPALDVLVVPGSDDLPHRDWDPTLLAAARLGVERARLVASVCTGAFVLAELGLLEGRRATTHWREAQLLARRYPGVQVEPDVLHVHDGRFVTSAGISAGIDLALYLVELQRGAAAAREIARDLVVFLHRPGGQSQFSPALRHPLPRTGQLHDLLQTVHTDPAQHTVASMARAANLSPRHLARLFTDELGTTPARWLTELRLDHACRLILDGYTVTETALASGFGSDESLRRAFAKHLGSTPSEYRERFASTRDHDGGAPTP
ncbi:MULTISPECIES: GlxA family transcriptional regulator [unclassified Luteococcus]|uniref:GlxA family transcriptional regulator n=1 Tax=unclassified Luteococcus TaxID=2639923 RepID=UPI00313F0619